MESGRELFSRFLDDAPMSRPPFVPMIRGLISRVEGITLERLNNDPSLWANSILKTHNLFRFDGVVVGPDFTLMAEACGCEILWEDDRPVALPPKGGLSDQPQDTGRMRHALEAARRVFELSRKDHACIAAMTGPVTLSGMLFGRDHADDHLRDVKPMMVQVAEAFCRIGPDVVIFMEGGPLCARAVNRAHARIYNTLKNVLGYYDVKAGLYIQGYTAARLEDFKTLKPDLYVLGPSGDKTLPPVSRVWDLGKGTLGVGLGLPLNDLEKAEAIIQEGWELHLKSGGRGIFFTSLGAVGRHADLEVLHGLVNRIFHV